MIILRNKCFDYREVENLSAYVDQHAGGLNKMKSVQKQSPIRVRQGKAGEVVKTIASDGTVETINTVKNNGDFIAHNISNKNNEYIIGGKEKLRKKYNAGRVVDSKSGKLVYKRGLYVPKKGASMLASAPVTEDIRFTAPWGSKEQIKAGGRILMDPRNPKDIYGISGADFEAYGNQGATRQRMKKNLGKALKRGKGKIKVAFANRAKRII